MHMIGSSRIMPAILQRSNGFDSPCSLSLGKHMDTTSIDHENEKTLRLLLESSSITYANMEKGSFFVLFVYEPALLLSCLIFCLNQKNWGTRLAL